jgi:predicted TIM-barrel fold metal-dependent hydrolase
VIVDSHVHVVASDRKRYPLQPAVAGKAWYDEAPVSVERYVAEMDGAGVAAAVLVQAVGAYCFDNRYVLDAARVDPARSPGRRLRRRHGRRTGRDLTRPGRRARP